MMIALYKNTRTTVRHLYLHDYQGGLFQPYCLTIIEGTTKRKGKERMMSFDTRLEMEKVIEALLHKKREEGYQVLYSYKNRKRRISRTLWKRKAS